MTAETFHSQYPLFRKRLETQTKIERRTRSREEGGATASDDGVGGAGDPGPEVGALLPNGPRDGRSWERVNVVPGSAIASQVV